MSRVTITLTMHARAPVHDVFQFVTAKDVLPKILLGYGPLPGVMSTSESTGPWHVPGSFRMVHSKNGSSAREELTDHQPPTYFAYRTSDFTSVLKYVASQGRGQWWFTPDEQDTRVKWTVHLHRHVPGFTQPVLIGFRFTVVAWLYARGPA
jgi:hypothetical protein